MVFGLVSLETLDNEEFTIMEQREPCILVTETLTSLQRAVSKRGAAFDVWGGLPLGEKYI